MPTWILWLSPVVVMPVMAVLWMSWRSRPRGPVAAVTTVSRHDAFKRAMEAPVPVPRGSRRVPTAR